MPAEVFVYRVSRVYRLALYNASLRTARCSSGTACKMRGWISTCQRVYAAWQTLCSKLQRQGANMHSTHVVANGASIQEATLQ